MMTLETLRSFFGWCSVINMALLLWWFFTIVKLHDFVYKMHTKWFNLSPEKFDELHYAAMAFFKLTVFVFYVVPYIVLCIIS